MTPSEKLVSACAERLADADGYVFANLPDGLVFMCETDDGHPLPLAWGQRHYRHLAQAAIAIVVQKAAEVATELGDLHGFANPIGDGIAERILALSDRSREGIMGDRGER